jgi:octaprenyl-diphosphate synthase
MSQAVAQRGGASHDLRDLYVPVRAELEQVEQMLQEEVRCDHPFVNLLLKHGARLGGKRLRPALVLLSGKACGPLARRHLAAAAAIELVHTATLIHDDVLDEAALRRHLDTVNARWGNEVSVLLGDYLLARAICLINSLDDGPTARVIGDASRVMCEGELRQVESRGNFDLSEEQYLDIIAAKTAALCSCCCRLGAHHSGAGQHLQELLAQYGRFLGIAFQITDDVLDLSGDEATVGKSLGTDLAKQKPTLPLIRLLRSSLPDQRDQILAVLARSDNHYREALKPWLDRSDAIAYAQQRAGGYAEQAKRQLDAVPPSPARQALLGLADFVVSRRL